MAEKHDNTASSASSFLGLLTRDFRWPGRGDKPFSISKRWEDNAYLEASVASRFVMMMISYKKIADQAVGSILKAGGDSNALIYPIIFNYRHFIELSLKYLISTYGPAVGISPNWDSHILSDLWRQFKDVLDRYGHDSDDTDRAVEKVILDFARVDPKSFSYRYPVDTKGKEVPLQFQEVDLRNLADVMQGLENYFTGCDGYLDDLKNAGP